MERGLLATDDSEIAVVPDAQRKAWESKGTGYSREDFERDRAQRAGEGGGLSERPPSREEREAMLRPYPMKDGPPIPWFIAEAIHRHLYRFSQTLERMAERGGFAWSEVEYLGKNNSTGEQRAACDKQVREGFAALSFVRQRAGEGEEDKDSPEPYAWPRPASLMRMETPTEREARVERARERGTYRGRPWRRCQACGRTCYWHDEAWVCTHCGSEWYPSGSLGEAKADDLYDPPVDDAGHIEKAMDPLPAQRAGEPPTPDDPAERELLAAADAIAEDVPDKITATCVASKALIAAREVRRVALREPPTPDGVERAATLEAALRHALSEAEAIATGAPEESHIPAYQEMALSIVLQARAALKAIR